VGNQYGFRKGVATEDAIFKLTNEILSFLNNKTMAGNIFCKLEKAFESVNHDILLSKLPYYGVSHKARLLPASYLQNRYRRVQIIISYLNPNTVSELTKIRYGVPAGFNLGPVVISSIHK
jgi:sarcosine oxidase/L-pipecolate oxidase